MVENWKNLRSRTEAVSFGKKKLSGKLRGDVPCTGTLLWCGTNYPV